METLQKDETLRNSDFEKFAFAFEMNAQGIV